MSRYRGKYYSPKRRKIYAQGDDIDHLTLFHLHGWMCFCCKEPIDPKRRFPDPYAATVEHIVPLSKGGDHTWDNVAASHAACNFSRGDCIEDGLDRPKEVC